SVKKNTNDFKETLGDKITKPWTCPAGPSDGKNQGILPEGSLLAFFLRPTVQVHGFVAGGRFRFLYRANVFSPRNSSPLQCFLSCF
ncbi:MAG: hypothetical protein J6Y30_02665, partial [Treponema sp.]|nr:hypothetical protein [Treponema sp.]